MESLSLFYKRLPIFTKAHVLLFVFFQCGVFPTWAQSTKNSSTVDPSVLWSLIHSVGISGEEMACLEHEDKKCLFALYREKWATKNPLSNTLYHDTLSWKSIADSFRKRAATDDDPKSYFTMTRRSVIFYYLAGNAKHSNYELQNLGFMYDESVQMYDSSVYFINLAMSRWEQMKDTLFTANLYKYRAYLSTKTDLVKDGKADARKAIELYSLKGFQSGVMVSYRDLATIFIKEGQRDSANYYLYKAKTHWETEKDTSRLVDINTQLLRANFANSEIANTLLEENDLFISKNELYPIELIAYYEAAAIYAEHSGNNALKEKYKGLRAALE